MYLCKLIFAAVPLSSVVVREYGVDSSGNEILWGNFWLRDY